MRQPLTKQQVIEAIERTSPGNAEVPLFMHKFWGVGTEEKYGEELYKVANKYPDDIFTAWSIMPGRDKSVVADPNYKYGYKDNYDDSERHSIGENIVLLPDWDELDLFVESFPDPNTEGNFAHVLNDLPQAGERYKIGAFWHFFHEALWQIRGMENLFMDYYDNMDGLKVVGNKLLEFFKVIVDKFAELGFNGIFTSDDLGHQTGPMMSPAVFEELFLPLYKDFIAHVHSKGMHFFLHSCGDNAMLMDYLIEAKVDVFHPVQKGCMDEAETVKNYGDKITFLYGIDVQHLLPEGSPEEVKAEIIEMAKLFYKKEGGLLFAAGNGIMPDIPLENIDVMLDTVTNIRKYL